MSNNKGIDITKRRSFVFSDLCRRITVKSITKFLRFASAQGVSKRSKKKPFVIYTNKSQLIGSVIREGNIFVRVIRKEGIQLKNNKKWGRSKTKASYKFVYAVSLETSM